MKWKRAALLLQSSSCRVQSTRTTWGACALIWSSSSSSYWSWSHRGGATTTGSGRKRGSYGPLVRAVDVTPVSDRSNNIGGGGRTTLSSSSMSPPSKGGEGDVRSSSVVSTTTTTTTMPMPMAMKDFLSARKSNPTDHIVIGNEAGDADSIVSAVTLSYVGYLEEEQEEKEEKKNGGGEVEGERHVVDVCDSDDGGMGSLTPVISIPRIDLETQRPETTFLLDVAGIPAPSLREAFAYVDDLPNYLLRRQKRSGENVVNVTLVDHNKLSESIIQLTKSDGDDGDNNNNETTTTKFNVIEILDHHLDLGMHSDTCPAGDDEDDDDVGTNDDGGRRRRRRRRRVVAFSNDGDGGGGKALVASTCTLVAERLRNLYSGDHDDDDENGKRYPSTLGMLLLGTILLDSINMSPHANKGTERDRVAIQDLLRNTHWDDGQLSPKHYTADDEKKNTIFRRRQKEAPSSSSSSGGSTPVLVPDTSALYGALQNAKFDPDFWRSLSAYDALRLDYKNFVAAPAASSTSTTTTFGMSTVLMPLSDFRNKPNLEREIRRYMDGVHIDFLAVMLSFSVPDGTDAGDGPPFRRQLVLCGKKKKTKRAGGEDDEVANRVADFLLSDTCGGDENNKSNALELEEIALHDDDDKDTGAADDTTRLEMRFFHQNNIKASRKQVAPMLLRFFEEEN